MKANSVPDCILIVLCRVGVLLNGHCLSAGGEKILKINVLPLPVASSTDFPAKCSSVVEGVCRSPKDSGCCDPEGRINRWKRRRIDWQMVERMHNILLIRRRSDPSNCYSTLRKGENRPRLEESQIRRWRRTLNRKTSACGSLLTALWSGTFRIHR